MTLSIIRSIIAINISTDWHNQRFDNEVSSITAYTESTANTLTSQVPTMAPAMAKSLVCRLHGLVCTARVCPWGPLYCASSLQTKFTAINC